jgi:RNA polymerase sigma factor (sigma-70 family)
LQRWRQFDPRREMGVWLLSIAHNAHLDGLRRDARMTVTDPVELQQAQDAAGGDHGADVGLRMDLQAALALLPAEQREALLLVCVEQLSYAEVAEVMNIPMGTVMSRVCRARAVLRRFLDGSARPADAGAAQGGVNMDQHRISDERLSAWLDGELDAAAAAEVQAWLQAHPEGAARVRQWAADRDALRTHFARCSMSPCRSA